MAVTFTRQSPTWADGHTVYAEDAERWEQLGADVDAWSAGVLDGIALRSGEYHFNAGFGGSAVSRAMTAGTATLTPFYPPVEQTFNQLAVNVATASGGAVVRLMVYEVGSNGTVGALILDAGTVSAATTGDKTVGVSLTLPPRPVWTVMVSSSSSVSMRAVGAAPAANQRFWSGRPGPLEAIAKWAQSTGWDATSAAPDPGSNTSLSFQSGDIPLISLRAA